MPKYVLGKRLREEVDYDETRDDLILEEPDEAVDPPMSRQLPPRQRGTTGDLITAACRPCAPPLILEEPDETVDPPMSRQLHLTFGGGYDDDDPLPGRRAGCEGSICVSLITRSTVCLPGRLGVDEGSDVSWTRVERPFF